MYLLDTDVLIWISRNKKETINFVGKLKNRGPIYISTITIAEIYKNIFTSEISATEDYINQNIVLVLGWLSWPLGAGKIFSSRSFVEFDEDEASPKI